ncbi:DUF4124 domain-containing protein [Chitinimonas sp. PSY-7]|uniref:DUF4124 domain-containing protein n=1 Tax=Chitinimonas sp. PSY-7 TaxID=3459088 RepID=UPI00404028A4
MYLKNSVNNLRCFLWVGLLVGIVPSVMAGKVYKCTKATGSVQYSSIPCSADQKGSAIRTVESVISGDGKTGETNSQTNVCMQATAEYNVARSEAPCYGGGGNCNTDRIAQLEKKIEQSCTENSNDTAALLIRSLNDKKKAEEIRVQREKAKIEEEQLRKKQHEEEQLNKKRYEEEQQRVRQQRIEEELSQMRAEQERFRLMQLQREREERERLQELRRLQHCALGNPSDPTCPNKNPVNNTLPVDCPPGKFCAR